MSKIAKSVINMGLEDGNELMQRMAASLRSTRSVAKAALPDRMGRIDHRPLGSILTVNASGGSSFSGERRLLS
jgi:hypothetical protein